VPLQLQILESDHLYDYSTSATNGNTINRGIEYDKLGRRIAYHIYKHHPGSSAIHADWGATVRVPADEIIHLMRRDRPGQERGVTWLAPVMITLRELDLYEDAYLKRQSIANAFAGFVTTDEVATARDEITDLAGGIEPGSLYVMRPGESLEFPTPPRGDDYGPYTLSNLRRVAAGLNITYESLTGDLSEVNFSSARMGWQEFGRSVEAWRWNLFIPQFCDTVARWFAAYSGIDATAQWTPPARMMVDPAREVPAIKEAIRSGLITQSEAVRQQGYDPEQLWQESAADNARLDALGLVLDSDPRQNLIKETA
jgi:lambda family phage portal protein